MNDPVRNAFLGRQHEEGLGLVRDSDLLQLLPLPSGDGPPDRYVARFHCKGLVRRGGEVVAADLWEVGIWMPDDYLRKAHPANVLHWFGPPDVFHPNIAPPLICVGHVLAGTPLVDLLYQIFEVITFSKVNCGDPLNRVAAEWARGRLTEFPVDRRPLKRRRLTLQVQSRKETG